MFYMFRYNISRFQVREMVKCEAKRRQWPIETVQMEAKNITDEMAHAFQLNAVRTLGFPLGYALKVGYKKSWLC